jgi:hypothetical protein
VHGDNFYGVKLACAVRQGNPKLAELICEDGAGMVNWWDMRYKTFGLRLGFMLVFAVGMAVAGMGQGKKKIQWPSKAMCPLRGGFITLDTAARAAWRGDRSAGLSIEGTDSLVVSVKDGIVQAIFSVGEIKAVMIRSGVHYFYTYCNLDTVFVNKGQEVKSGQVLGILQSEMPLDFVFSTDKGSSPENQLRFVDCKVVYVKRS